ncbi:MAG: hypothetical protein QOJ02_4301 [Acidobacteriota bacterium]|jgi:hypothetical protein|nr:hypothetical protein [Acidobacteriota bacterium]
MSSAEPSISITTSYWDEYHTLSDQYVNDRNTNPSWSYDADGRVLWGDETGYLYDASGNVTSFGDFAEVKTNQVFDGEGRRVRSEEWKFNESVWQSQSVTYYLTSSVLGGAVVTELEATGAKRRTFVHAGGSILAWQWKGVSGVNDSVEWEHRDASGASFRVTNSAGSVIGETVGGSTEAEPAEMDHFGANAGLSAPPVPDTNGREGDIGSNHMGGSMDSRYADLTNISGRQPR